MVKSIIGKGGDRASMNRSEQLWHDLISVARGGVLRKDMLLYTMLENPEYVIESLEARRRRFK